MAARRKAHSDTDEARALARKLVELDEKETKDLVAMYEERHGQKPRSWHRSHLLSVLANDVQEQALGGLSRRARRRMHELVAQAPPAWRDRAARAGLSSSLAREERGLPSSSTATQGLPPIGSDKLEATVPSRGRDARLPPPGSFLTRVYDRREHHVLVREDTFEYEGRVFTSLTAVAKEITGGKQTNGFYFFRLTAEAR
jgi:hypothetical protein